MTWANTWKDILRGGSPRWKIDDVKVKQQALACIQQYSKDTQQALVTPLHIFCPLAGDDPFVHQAWLQGHHVTSLDLVPEAVAVLRKQFGVDDENDWTVNKEGSTAIWQHKSGRATLYVGDMLQNRPELAKKFDAVYDKDSFGALDKDMRSKFCERLSEYTKDNATVYVEVKFKDADSPGRALGPPFHIEKVDLMEQVAFGADFQYVSGLGEVYELGMSGMSQTGHILKRLTRI